ncbi:Gamma-tubulin complex component 5 [Mortierella sp. AD031]|nr:Gamma-tubulin complex component 5 [Mortierella sp. AD031]
MECWLSGQSLDSGAEFMIKQSPQVDLFSAEFWTNGYHIQAEIVVDNGDSNKPGTFTAQISPRFLSEYSLKQLLYAGKAMQISLALKSFEASIPMATGFASTVSQRMFEGSTRISVMDGSSQSIASIQALEQEFPGYTAILEQQYPLSPLLPLISDAIATSNLSDHSMAIDLTWRMESELASAIQDQYLSTNTLLKSLLFTQSRLKWHLKGMSEFFFMMQGEVMHLFAATVFSKMKRKRPWLDSYTLESTFHQVATLCDWKYAKFVKVRVGDGKRSWTDLTRLKAQTLELIEFDYMELPVFWKLRMRFMSTMNDLWSYLVMTVIEVQVQKFQSEIEGQGDLDDMIRLSRRFISVCYERCFLKDKTLPLHRSLLTMLNLALEFSTLFSRFIAERGQDDEKRAKDAGGLAPASERTGRSGRRVSFNATPIVNPSRGRHVVVPLTEDLSSDSEEDSYDQEQHQDEDDDDQERRGVNRYLAHDDIHQADEDIEMDLAEGSISVKKQRIDSNSTGLHRERTFHRREYSRADASRKASQGGVGSGSYRESLEAIEQEFNRCREFLTKSLRVVVSSNAARGFAARRGGAQLGEQEGGGEGDSDYLDGLILALSS